MARLENVTIDSAFSAQFQLSTLLGLIDVLSADQLVEMFACILLAWIEGNFKNFSKHVGGVLRHHEDMCKLAIFVLDMQLLEA